MNLLKDIHTYIQLKKRLLFIATKLTLLSGIVMLSACFQQSSTSPNAVNTSLDSIVFSNQIILGEKLDDPYTVEAMQEALDSLIANRNAHNQKQGLFKTVNQVPRIQANHLYIRFLPKGKQQVDYIQRRDRDLVLHRQPLDYEIVQEGDSYFDPALPKNVVAFYSVVPVDYQFTDTIQYEVLKELFLVEPLLEDEQSLTSLSKTSSQTLSQVLPNNTSLAKVLPNLGVGLEELERTSLYLKNRLEDVFSSSEEKASFLSKQNIVDVSQVNLDNVISWWRSIKCYRPRVHIRYMDDRLKIQSVKGVRITMGRAYGWYSRYTDENGRASGKFRCSSVKYQLHWDDDNFVLQDEGWEWDGGGLFIGHHQVRRGNFWSIFKSTWDVTFTGKEARFAVAYAAARTYYYGDINGLPRPRKDKWYSPRVDIELHNKFGKSNSLPATVQTDHVGLEDVAGAGFIVTHPWALLIAVEEAFCGIFDLFESIIIYTKQKDFRSTSDQFLRHDYFYELIIHELAHNAFWEHSAHYNVIVDLIHYPRNSVKKLIESYAEGVAWWLTSKEYTKYIPSKPSSAYTAIMRDLIDTNTRFGPLRKSPYDLIRGFNIKQLSDIFMSSVVFNDVRNSVISLVSSDTTSYLKALNRHIDNYLNAEGWSISYRTSYLLNYLKDEPSELQYLQDALSHSSLTSFQIDSTQTRETNVNRLRETVDTQISKYYQNLNNLFDYWNNY